MQRQGFGSKLMAYVEEHSRQSGCQGVLLETGRDIPWLVAWYQKRNFKIIGTYKYPSTPDTIFMLKRLPEL